MPKLAIRTIWSRLLLTAFLPLGTMWAQTPTGEILGTVLDPTGAVVSGAVITITNTSTGVERKLATNSAGVYTAPALSPGTYTVRIALKGFRSSLRSNIDVAVGQEIRVNFTLELGDVSESVQVSA